MTLKQFLDAAYVLLIEEYQRIGLDLLTSIEKVAQWTAGAVEGESQSSAHQNDQAMAELQAKLAGVHRR